MDYLSGVAIKMKYKNCVGVITCEKAKQEYPN